MRLCPLDPQRPGTGLCLAMAALLQWQALFSQTVVARLDLDRRSPQPSLVEYVAADGGIVTLGNQTSKSSRYLCINKYDDQFSKSWTRQVLQQNGQNGIDMMTVLGENIYVFDSEYFPRDRTIRTSYTRFDLGGNVVVPRKEIANLPNEEKHRVDLKYVHSINKKKLLCYKNLEEDGKFETILYYLFDANTSEMVTGKIQIPYLDDKFQVRKIMVSNAGKIYVLGKYFKVNRVKTPDDFGFKIYQYEPGSPEAHEASIDLGELYITDLTLKIDRDENLFLAGFYSHQSANQIIGTCFFKFNGDLKEEVRSSQHFSEDFLANFLRDRQIEKGHELQNFYLDNIILRSDGGVLLIAEKFYTTFNSYVDIYGYWVDQKIFHYDEIIVNSVAATGDLEWSAVVPKQQQSSQRGHLSYVEVVSGTNLYLVYGHQIGKTPQTVYVNNVDFDGKVADRKALLPGAGHDETFYPQYSEQISNSTALIVYFQDREKLFSMVKVAFD
ncbi:MAG: hypothetical protein RLZZ165_306 [Bacteroidota bacterium]